MAWRCKKCNSTDITIKLIGECLVEGDKINSSGEPINIIHFDCFSPTKIEYKCKNCGEKAEFAEKIAKWIEEDK